MLALLPLRGWAVASMVMPAAPAGIVSAASVASSDHSAPTTAHCHEAAADNNGSVVNACTLCDLCHSASSVSPEIVLPVAPVPDALPRPAMARDTGRAAVGGLERPPRPLLA